MALVSERHPFTTQAAKLEAIGITPPGYAREENKMASKVDWYDNIEPGVRDLVRLLRNNGVNTYYSCDHAMVVEAENYQDEEVTMIHNLLMENGYDNFIIELRLYQHPGQLVRRNIRIKLPMKDGSFCER